MAFIEHFDSALLYFINLKMANPIVDWLSIAFSDYHYYIWPILAGVLLALIRGDYKAKTSLALVVICVILVDTSTYYVLKAVFSRPRPCHVLSGLRLIVGCGGHYGFPSNHAVNTFTAAAIIGAFYRRHACLFFLMAGFISFTRIYLGKHYPTDVLAGALWGLIVALAALYLIRILASRLPSGNTWDEIKKTIKGALVWNNPKTTRKAASQE